jgi:ankyrin repeat protein
MIALGADVNQQSEDGTTSLHMACDEALNVLLEYGADVSQPDKSGRIPLHTKAQGGHLESVRSLLAHGSPIDLPDNYGITPLFLAVGQAQDNVVAFLINAGADAHTQFKLPCCKICYQSTHTSHFDISLLHLAATVPEFSNAIVNSLLGAGLDINMSPLNGCTPLLMTSDGGTISWNAGGVPYACSCKSTLREHADAVKHLLIAGADVKATTPGQLRTSLHGAAQRNFPNVAALLIGHCADINAQDKTKCTPLHLAAEFDSTPVVSLLLEDKADVCSQNADGFTPLHIAACTNSVESAEVLLRQRIDMNVLTEEEGNKLSALHLAVAKNCVDFVRLLLKYGADVDAREAPCRYTPLHYAAEYNLCQIAKLLLEHGAVVDATDMDGFTPLHRGAYKDNTEMVSLLLEHRADINAATKKGTTALMISARNKSVNVTRLLLERGADVDATNDLGSSCLYLAASFDALDIAQIFLEYGANVSCNGRRDMMGPLHIFAQKNEASLAETLLQRWKVANAKNRQGETPLHIAARENATAVTKVLLKYRGYVDAKNALGETPLQIAARCNAVDVAKVLVASGAHVGRTGRKETLLITAKEAGASEEMISLLTDAVDGRVIANIGKKAKRAIDGIR